MGGAKAVRLGQAEVVMGGRRQAGWGDGWEEAGRDGVEWGIGDGQAGW